MLVFEVVENCSRGPYCKIWVYIQLNNNYISESNEGNKGLILPQMWLDMKWLDNLSPSPSLFLSPQIIRIKERF